MTEIQPLSFYDELRGLIDVLNRESIPYGTVKGVRWLGKAKDLEPPRSDEGRDSWTRKARRGDRGPEDR